MSEISADPSRPGYYILVGELNFDTVPIIFPQGKAMLAGDEDTINFDLSEVKRVDSAGVALLVEWMRMVKSSGKTILFHNIPEQMLAIARVSGLEDILPLD